MAEEEGATDGEEQQADGAETQANGSDNQPQVGIISQYVKDLSFENPNSPAVYQWQGQPKIDVEFNIGAQKLGDDINEVTLQINVTATGDNQTAFRVELVYAGLLGMRNVPEEQAHPFVLAEAPRLLFPYARQIIDHAVRDGGFAPLLLDPIDFLALYLQRVAEQQEAVGGGTAGEITGQA